MRRAVVLGIPIFRATSALDNSGSSEVKLSNIDVVFTIQETELSDFDLIFIGLNLYR